MSTHSERIGPAAFYRLVPGVNDALRAVGKTISESGLGKPVIELVKIRASQINGCAFCLQMHVTEAREVGVTEEQLQLVAAWREAPVFNDRERAALAWAEALTTIAVTPITDELYADALRQFGESGLANLTSLVALINAWNRIAISNRYRPLGLYAD